MPLFRQCCCCVTLQTGGVMMGVMTLAMSVFSIVPMSISLTNRCWLSIYLQYLQFIYNIYTNICRFYLARVIVYMLARYGRQEDESQQVTERRVTVHWPSCNHAFTINASFLYVKYFQAAFEPMEFWGTVSDIFKKDGPEQLPAEDDSKVVRLATAMLIFFIVCIILLIVYLLCRWTAILTSALKKFHPKVRNHGEGPY